MAVQVGVEEAHAEVDAGERVVPLDLAQLAHGRRDRPAAVDR